MKHLGKKQNFIVLMFLVLAFLFALSLMTGKYPLTFGGLMDGDTQQLRVFWTLRLPRSLVAVIGGFALGIAGMIYQIIFQNPLAAPDMIGVSSGASAGAAFGLLFLGGSMGAMTMSAFTGSLIAVGLALLLSYLVPGKHHYTIVLAGIAVHALAQTALMMLKLTADPERELAAIEYWIMGSLNGITMGELPFMIILSLICVAALFLLYRQVLLLSIDHEEAALLGVPVTGMRIVVLLLSTMLVAAVVSVTGIISFIGLLAPHCAKLLMKDYRIGTLWMSGIFGGVLLCIADILARTVSVSELPVSIFTSLLGAPFLIYLLMRKESSRG